MSKSKQCGSCGANALVAFSDETHTIEHLGMKQVLTGLSGWRCAACGEVLFDSPSMKRYAAASDALVIMRRQKEGQMIRDVRTHLNLTQKEAAALTGGGVNAFSRYETGKTRPMPAVVNLFKLLGAHPSLLRELRTNIPSSTTETVNPQAVVAHKMAKKRRTPARTKSR